jgi:two-component system CheB/CheR fusion protein
MTTGLGPSCSQGELNLSTQPNATRRAKKAASPALDEASASALTPCVAGIGASAGGFDAIRHFFQALPADTGVAYVVVQHLDPTHVSLAAELFANHTTMPVVEASDGVLLQANHVYTSPSNREVAIRQGRLQLTPRSDRGTLHLPIDHFFGSLGEDCGTRAIGIVLSGMGTDGALGLKSIAAHGGIVLVQDPATAEYDGMPRSAIAAGIANYVLRVSQMPQVIADYARHPYANGKGGEGETPHLADPEAVQNLIQIVHTQRGYDFSGYKRGTLMRRIERRMGLRGTTRLPNYVDLLKSEPAEVDALFRDLLIGVTEFFRDAPAWKALEADVIAPLVESKQSGETIRIWVPGCSTGEEAYTVAIIVLDHLRRARKKCPVQVFATDTNNDALEVGRCGRYPAGIATRVTAARLKRYFTTGLNQQHFTVSQELRTSIVFGAQNLFSDPPFGRVDLISCRNVLIYLESDLQKRVLKIFHFALGKNGYLFLGSAESNGNRDELFQPLSKKWRIFKRVGKTPTDVLNLLTRPGELRPVTLAQVARSAPPLSQVATVAQKLILDRFCPASVLIDGRNEALYYCGPTEEFLVRPRGAPVQDLLLMVREGLRSRLRAALREAADSNATVVATGARMKQSKGFVPVEITVTPHTGGESGPLYLVVFRHDIQAALPPPDDTAEGALIRHLEEELNASRDDLQNTIEGFVTSAEDLKVSNEEVITTNEELRSLNEELESSKEELQSMNEELTTVNQQLDAKVRELEGSNSDLNSLLNSSEIATLCIDQSFRIKWFTPAAKTLFQFLPSDIGRPLSDFSLANAGDALIDTASAVMSSKEPQQLEFQSTTTPQSTIARRRLLRRVAPYRDDNSQVTGAIVTFADITESVRAAKAAQTARKDLSDSRAQTDRLRTLSSALAVAETRERRALAQDLHDDLGQMLALIKLKISSIEKLPVPDFMQSAMDDCSRAVDQANRKVRVMAFQLSPPMLDELGLPAAMEWMADEMHKMYKLDVTAKDDGQPKPLNPDVSATLFRAIRELLINTAKHADVSHAIVSTELTKDQQLLVTVSDAGAGFDPDQTLPASDQGGFGLLSVRERIQMMGGEVTIRSNPGNGTTVFITVPLLNSNAPDKPN